MFLVLVCVLSCQSNAFVVFRTLPRHALSRTIQKVTVKECDFDSELAEGFLHGFTRVETAHENVLEAKAALSLLQISCQKDYNVVSGRSSLFLAFVSLFASLDWTADLIAHSSTQKQRFYFYNLCHFNLSLINADIVHAFVALRSKLIRATKKNGQKKYFRMYRLYGLMRHKGPCRISFLPSEDKILVGTNKVAYGDMERFFVDVIEFTQLLHDKVKEKIDR